MRVPALSLVVSLVLATTVLSRAVNTTHAHTSTPTVDVVVTVPLTNHLPSMPEDRGHHQMQPTSHIREPDQTTETESDGNLAKRATTTPRNRRKKAASKKKDDRQRARTGTRLSTTKPTKKKEANLQPHFKSKKVAAKKKVTKQRKSPAGGPNNVTNRKKKATAPKTKLRHTSVNNPKRKGGKKRPTSAIKPTWKPKKHKPAPSIKSETERPPSATKAQAKAKNRRPRIKPKKKTTKKRPSSANKSKKKSKNRRPTSSIKPNKKTKQKRPASVHRNLTGPKQKGIKASDRCRSKRSSGSETCPMDIDAHPSTAATAELIAAVKGFDMAINVQYVKESKSTVDMDDNTMKSTGIVTGFTSQAGDFSVRDVEHFIHAVREPSEAETAVKLIEAVKSKKTRVQRKPVHGELGLSNVINSEALATVDVVLDAIVGLPNSLDWYPANTRRQPVTDYVFTTDGTNMPIIIELKTKNALPSAAIADMRDNAGDYFVEMEGTVPRLRRSSDKLASKSKRSKDVKVMEQVVAQLFHHKPKFVALTNLEEWIFVERVGTNGIAISYEDGKTSDGRSRSLEILLELSFRGMNR